LWSRESRWNSFTAISKAAASLEIDSATGHPRKDEPVIAMIRLSTVVVLFGLLFLDCALAKSSERFRDFSQLSPDYSPLESFRFSANDVKFLGPSAVDIFDRSYSALTYSVATTVTVETSDAIGATYTSTYEKRPASFEVSVVEDRDRSIHDTFVKEMYSLWSKEQLFSGQYFFDFHVKNRDYVLTALPDMANGRSFYFVWVNGRAALIRFKGFERSSDGGWGAIYSFTSDCFRISIDNSEVKAYQFPLRPQTRFVELYNKGFFN
jgi:hypothetical protein